jgi:hypothetical protein
VLFTVVTGNGEVLPHDFHLDGLVHAPATPG